MTRAEYREGSVSHGFRVIRGWYAAGGYIDFYICKDEGVYDVKPGLITSNIIFAVYPNRPLPNT